MATKGFSVRCPLCGDEHSLRLHIDDVSTITCAACDNEITADDIKAIIAQWNGLLAWIATAPTRKD